MELGAYTAPRSLPPLAESRRVNEQDCRQPVEPTAGNLYCR
jgi:hypothetical protein